MEVSLSLAQWVVGKALSPVTDYLLESWAASAGLNPNIDALKMELLYAQGMLENAQGMDIRSSSLKELLQKLRQLAYRADDVLDELVYFRIQDALEGTYHATAVHEPGCIDGLVVNIGHIAKHVASTLKLPSCSCAGSSVDLDEQENGGKQGCLSGVPFCHSHDTGSNLVASSAPSAAHFVGKHFPFYSFPSMAQNRNHVMQTPKLEFNRVDMSKKMVDIVGQLKPVCAMVSTILNLELLNSSRLSSMPAQGINRSRTTPDLIEPPFCGRDDLKKMIVDNVTREYSANKLITVLPIVGSGGIGKTTLAHHVYKELENHFQVSIWICVSVNFSANRLTQKIVKMIPDVRGENKYGSDKELIEQRLKDKKFLLVLDDVWKCNMDEWRKLLAPFNKGRAVGNTVIVTTRFPKVAKMVGTIKCPIEVDRFDPRDMMNFFEACVFGDLEQPWKYHVELRDVGSKIVENLKGSPLAIKSVGRSLRNQLTWDHWTRVLESKEWEVGSSDNDTMSALRLSYDNLPFSLRHCVAYCGLFPEDYEFDKKELVQLWIALDILHSHSSKRGKRVEDVGLCYISELVNYGFLQEKTREDGRPYYLIHDLVHELAVMVLPYECLRLHSSNVGSIQIPQSVRHLSIIVDDIDVWDRMSFEQYKTNLSALGKRLKVEDLRTLILFGEYHGSFANIFADLFGEARALRTLILSGASYNIVDIFHNFSNFVHLRYLRVKSIKKDIFLPSALFRFFHLEILDLEEWHGYFGSSRYMSNLVKLRHFRVPEDEIQVHSDIFEVGKLKFLQELRRFVVGKESAGFEPSQLGKLKNIGGSLGIHNLERVQTKEEAEEFELMDKNYLEKLTLEWDINRSNTDSSQEQDVLECLEPHSNTRDLCIIGHGGRVCPSWLYGNLLVRNLKSLRLNHIAWENLPLTSGQRFENLTRLELVKIPKLSKISGDDLSGFWFHLEVFIIEDCLELSELRISSTQDNCITWFPRLRELGIVRCPNLVSLPPIPWTLASCSANIEQAGSGFEHLVLSEKYKAELSLSIKGKDGQGSMLWDGLSFSNLINLAELEMEKCPPLPLVHLQMLTSLKVLIICDSSNLLLAVEGESHVECLLPLEYVNIRWCGATGKELTWLLSHSPKITKLSIEYCEKITGLGVAELEQQMTATSETPLADKMQQETREEEMAAEGVLLVPPQLQELELLCCPELQLLSSSLNDDRAGGGGLQGILSLHTLKIRDCPKFLSSYSSPSSGCFLFPASLEKLTLASLEGMETLESLSNLTSLTNLSVYGCGELLGAGLWPLISQAQLTGLVVFETPKFFTSWLHDEELSSSSKHLHLQTDDVAGAASICSGLSSSLTNLSFSKIKEAKRFTKEQEKSLHLLTSLEELNFKSCDKLQRLPAGLINLTNLKRLHIENCPATRMLPKGSLPSSLQKLVINACPAFKSLPKKGLPNSLCELDVSGSNSEKLRRQCRKLNGTIPIIRT